MSDHDDDASDINNDNAQPQQQQNIQPQIITTVSNNNAKFPYLKKDEYEVWAMKMEYWITNNDMNIWKVQRNENEAKTRHVAAMWADMSASGSHLLTWQLTRGDPTRLMTPLDPAHDPT
ncbi:hypothetical protein Tco_0888415 [Tanacetum coccineum]